MVITSALLRKQKSPRGIRGLAASFILSPSPSPLRPQARHEKQIEGDDDRVTEFHCVTFPSALAMAALAMCFVVLIQTELDLVVSL